MPSQPQQPHVAQQQNVVRQWYMARLYGTPEAWQSVIDYFPTQTYWVNHAKQQLALIHLREDHWWNVGRSRSGTKGNRKIKSP